MVSALLTGPKSFSEIKEITNASDGNISIQAKKMNAESMLMIEKKFINNKPNTTYSITDHGIEVFKEYVDYLSFVLKQHQE